MNIVVVVLDWIHSFHGQTVAGVKMVLYLALHLCMLIIKRKNILILREETTQGLDNTTITSEDKYHVNFKESGKRFVLSLHYNESKSFLFINAVKMCQFKTKD